MDEVAESAIRPAASATPSRRMAYGGKTVYGARLGVLILDTQYPRIPGDPVNAATWPFPVLYKVVRGASPERVIRERAAGLLDVFLEAATELVATGADGLTTTCGFLALFQDQLAAHSGVPVAASSLMQIAPVQGLLPPGKRVGVLTANGPSLTADHLRAAGAPLDTPVGSTDDACEFNRTMNLAEPLADMAACEADVLAAGRALVADHPDLGAVVMECTRMVPFSRALREEIALPVYDIYSFVRWFHAGLAPRDFGHPGSAPRPFRER
jgi:hypothetical protein